MKKKLLLLAFVPLIGFAQTGIIYQKSRYTQLGDKGLVDKQLKMQVLNTPDSYYKKPIFGSNLKTATKDKYLLDSVYSRNSKEYYSYNANEKEILDITWEWESWNNNPEQWFPSSKDEYSYDASGNKILVFSYNYDIASSKWFNSSKLESFYNSNGKDTSDIYSDWENNQWFVSYKSESFYDANGKNTLNININWYWSDGSLTGGFKNESYYDIKGRDTSDFSFNWDISTNQWDTAGKNKFYYDANGIDTAKIGYNWDNTLKKWIYSSEDEYTNFTNGNQTLSQTIDISSVWNTSNNKWVYQNKWDCFCDANGNDTANIMYNWMDNNWVFSYEFKFTYDANGNQTSMCTPAYCYYYYYSVHDINSSINPINLKVVKIYPNPANEFINIEISDNSINLCQIYNSNGQMIKSIYLVPDNNSYNISNLKAGLYFIQIPIQNGIITRKMIKK